MIIRLIFYTLLFTTLISCQQSQSDNIKQKAQASDLYFAVGTYTQKEGHVDGKASGIYIARLNESQQSIEIVDSLTGITNPSYLTIDDKGQRLYAVSEVGGEPAAGLIRVYAYDDAWKFKELNEAKTGGNAPCHLALNTGKEYLMTANYMGGISSHKIETDGRIGSMTDIKFHEGYGADYPRQAISHPHMIYQTVTKNQVIVCDLGSNQLFHYELRDGHYHLLTSTQASERAGPRHLIHHPSERYIYTLNELSNTVEAFTYQDLTQPMQRIQSVSTLSTSEGSTGMSASAIKIHPNGTYLYTANRGADQNSISVFKINHLDGTIEMIQQIDSGGAIPRDFEITPSAHYLLVANQNSDNITLLAIDQNSGTLSNIDKSFDVATPVCIKFF